MQARFTAETMSSKASRAGRAGLRPGAGNGFGSRRLALVLVGAALLCGLTALGYRAFTPAADFGWIAAVRESANRRPAPASPRLADPTAPGKDGQGRQRQHSESENPNRLAAPAGPPQPTRRTPRPSRRRYPQAGPRRTRRPPSSGANTAISPVPTATSSSRKTDPRPEHPGELRSQSVPRLRPRLHPPMCSPRPQPQAPAPGASLRARPGNRAAGRQALRQASSRGSWCGCSP